MKIAHVIEYFPSTLRYQEYYLASFQARFGHEVVVITSDRTPRMFRGIEPVPRRGFVRVQERFSVVRLPVWLDVKGITALLRGLSTVLRELRPDVVHCHGLTYKITPWQLAALKREQGFGLVLDIHESRFNTNPASGLAKRAWHFFHKHVLARKTLAVIDHLVAIGPDEAEFVCTQFHVDPSRVTVIPLGVDCDLFRPNPLARARVRTALRLQDHEVVIVHTGKFGPEKEVDVLLRAVAVCAAQADVKVLLVGHPTEEWYETRLKSIAADLGLWDRVIWYPLVERERLAEFLAASDIAVWPGNPSISILEAMSSGLPLLLPGEVGLSRLYTQMNNGFIFPRGDWRALGSLIRQLTSDTQLRFEMGARSRRLAVDCFSWPRIAKAFLDLYCATR